MARNFAALNRQVCFNQAGGRIIWQPRIQCWYDDKMFMGEPLPPRYRGMSMSDIYRDLDCSNRLYRAFNKCFVRVESDKVRITERALNETDTETLYETPAGRQTEIHRKSPNSRSKSAVKWEVTTEEELKVAAWREENTTWTWDPAQYEKAVREDGDLGAATMFMPRMNVQSLYIEKMGCENGIYAIYDWPDTVQAYFRALEESHDRLMDVINRSPVDIINFGENIHSGTLSPELFLKYHLPACQRRCEKLHAAGKFICSHWDGDCRPLLPYARETGLDGIEAITPKPQGDVTLEEVKEALGDQLCLLDGIPAVYFDHTFPESVLVESTRRVIELFAPKLVLGISDEISSHGDIERVRIVGQIVDEYNARFS